MAHLISARVVETTHVRGLRADGWESHLKIIKDTKCLVELGIDMWHVRSKRVLLTATVIALRFHSASL